MIPFGCGLELFELLLRLLGTVLEEAEPVDEQTSALGRGAPDAALQQHRRNPAEGRADGSERLAEDHRRLGEPRHGGGKALDLSVHLGEAAAGGDRLKDQFDDVSHVVLYFRSDERRRSEKCTGKRRRARLRVRGRCCHCRRHCASPGELDPFEGVGGRGSVDAAVGAFAHRLLISLRAST